MNLRDIMTSDVECVRPEDTLQEAARKMKTLDVGLMPVCGDQDKVVGMLTDRDITIRATAEGMEPEDDQGAGVHVRRRCLVLRRSGYGRSREADAGAPGPPAAPHGPQQRLVGVVSLGDLATGSKQERAGQVLQGVSEPSKPRR